MLRAASACYADSFVAWDCERRLAAPAVEPSADGHLREGIAPSRVVAALTVFGLACATVDERCRTGHYCTFLRCLLEAVICAQPLVAEAAISALVAVASARPASLGTHMCSLLRDLVSTVACARAAAALCCAMGRVAVAIPALAADVVCAVPRHDAASVPWRCRRAALMVRWLPQLRAGGTPALVAAARAVAMDLATTAMVLCGACESSRPRAVDCGLDLAAAVAGLFDASRSLSGAVLVVDDATARRLLACGVRALRELTARPVRGHAGVCMRCMSASERRWPLPVRRLCPCSRVQ